MENRQYTAYQPLLIRDNPTQSVNFEHNNRTISNSYNKISPSSNPIQQSKQQQQQYHSYENRKQHPAKLPAIREEYGGYIISPKSSASHQQYQWPQQNQQQQHCLQQAQQQQYQQQQRFQQPLSPQPVLSNYQLQISRPQQQQHQQYSATISYSQPLLPNSNLNQTQKYQSDTVSSSIQNPPHKKQQPNISSYNPSQQQLQQLVQLQNSYVMNSGTDYAMPTPVPYNNAIPAQHQQLQNQQQQFSQVNSSSYSTSPYSSSPQLRNSYPNSPGQPQGQYMPQQQKGNSNELLTNEVLSILAEKDVSTVHSNQQGNYSASPQHQVQQGQQQQLPRGGGYIDPQNYSQSPPNLMYYPYHRDFLNTSTDQPQQGSINNYSVKLPSGVVHQYPTPDYMGPNSRQQQQRNQHQPPPPDYPAGSYMASPQQQKQGEYSNQSPNSNTYQQSPQAQQQSPQYGNSSQQNLNYQTQTTPQQSPQYSHQMLSHIGGGNVKQQEGLQTPTFPTQNFAALSPTEFNSYRNSGLDSPQGSPITAPSQQSSQNVYKGPGTTPPMQRKTQPARQVSNELYNIGSPSAQLGDMSLNSPRPRSETIDMEAPPLPPRSPIPQTNQTQQYILNPDDDSKKMAPPPPPSSQIPSSHAPPQLSAQQSQLNPPQGGQQVDRRLRSGTVEMIDDPQQGRNGGQPPQRYLPSQGNNFPQRSRAGTVEMVDSSAAPSTLNPPEQRIRSGTVEMSETSQPTNQSAQGVPVKTEYNNQAGNQQLQKPAPPPYNNASSSPHQQRTTLSAPTKMPPPPAPGVKQTQMNNNNNKSQLQHQPPLSVYNGYNQQEPQQLTTNAKLPVYPQPPPLQYQQQPQQQLPISSQRQLQQQQQPNNTQIPSGNVTPNNAYKTSNGQVSPANTGYSNQGPASPVSGLGVENLKIYSHQQQHKSNNVSIKQEGNINQPSAAGQNELNDQELNQQQKVMQQQYMQRVRQAQLQQQLRQIQSEYENSLQVEQDVAQEFLREQGLNENAPHYNQEYNQGANYSTQPLQHPPQHQQTQPLQHAPYMHHPNAIPPRNYHPNSNIYQQQPQQIPERQQQRMPYHNKDVPVFPVTRIPLNEPQYQPRQPYPHQMPSPQQPRAIGSQPIVIMPGGGSFSNPGQFIPPSNAGGPRKDQQQAADPRTPPRSAASPSSGGKGQTPFQKLRKIAEEISSFVDDVVKFKGKKGDHEYKYLEEMLAQQLLLLDKVAASGSDELRNARKALVKEVQELLEILERRATNRS